MADEQKVLSAEEAAKKMAARDSSKKKKDSATAKEAAELAAREEARETGRESVRRVAGGRGAGDLARTLLGITHGASDIFNPVGTARSAALLETAAVQPKTISPGWHGGPRAPLGGIPDPPDLGGRVVRPDVPVDRSGTPISRKDLYERILAEKQGYAEELPDLARLGGTAAAVGPGVATLGKTALRLGYKGLSKIKPLTQWLREWVNEAGSKVGFSGRVAEQASKSPGKLRELSRFGEKELYAFAQRIAKEADRYAKYLSSEYEKGMKPLLAKFGKKEIPKDNLLAQVLKESDDYGPDLLKQTSFGRFLKNTMEQYTGSKIGKYTTPAAKKLDFEEALKLKMHINEKFTRLKGHTSVPDLSARDVAAARRIAKTLQGSIDATIVEDGVSLTKPINQAYSVGIKQLEVLGKQLGKKDPFGEFERIERSVAASMSKGGEYRARVFDKFAKAWPPAAWDIESARNIHAAKAVATEAEPAMRAVGGPGGAKAVATIQAGWLAQRPYRAALWLLGRIEHGGKRLPMEIVPTLTGRRKMEMTGLGRGLPPDIKKLAPLATGLAGKAVDRYDDDKGMRTLIRR